ncbi:glycosyltransferase involved in cell wall biosynthesis [Brachybacterium aquaticum]|uniref:Glycosyltransferase involved in cell wall biosynthesis n=2 Tax=Brachybacterium aquaticum TaxID=1432564 RepID=A0A841AFJ1_9MICO|nr:glycosyltransferase involved in cell wall biosynthesis [Brachybacterium aquaticum]
MLLGIASALRDIGVEVLVIGPTVPGTLLSEAEASGFRTTRLLAQGRRQYMTALRDWRRNHRDVPLWCNGLVPSTATVAQGPRVVHLHAVPGRTHRMMLRAARAGARAVLVPSQWMAAEVPRARVLENWTADIDYRPRVMPTDRAARIGYLGRLTRDKGVDVLARAIGLLAREDGQEADLVVAGENRFGNTTDDAAVAAALAPLEGMVERQGWVPREQLFEDVDMLVVPSAAPETFGLVAAEAMAAGLPVVVSDAGALPEVVGGTAAGIARAGDADHLARVIRAALRREPEKQLTLAAAARARWEALFSPAAGTRRVTNLLTALSDEVTT